MHEAVSQPNLEIVRLLLSQDSINLNLRNVLSYDSFVTEWFFFLNCS